MEKTNTINLYRLTHTYSVNPKLQDKWFYSDEPKDKLIELCAWIQLKAEVLLDDSLCIEETQVLEVLSLICNIVPEENIMLEKTKFHTIDLYQVRESFCGKHVVYFLNKFNYPLIEEKIKNKKKGRNILKRLVLIGQTIVSLLFLLCIGHFVYLWFIKVHPNGFNYAEMYNYRPFMGMFIALMMFYSLRLIIRQPEY
tara:strand:+ start:715 stop:1305 length:591 start_codon:yes stop_codon:yes gene_type:complete